MNRYRLLISQFLAENGLYRRWKRDTVPFYLSGWRGRRDWSISQETVNRIISTFSSGKRKGHFSLFFTSDYKYTYIGYDLLPDGQEIYLKHYRVSEAPRIIRFRNLLRRALAKKAMSAYYILREMEIETVKPLCYARREKVPVPDEAVFVSVAASRNVTLERVLQEEKGPGLVSLARSLGSYIGELHKKGVLHGELHKNIIPLKKTTAWRFVLCDLDELRSVAGMSEKHRIKYLGKLRDNLSLAGDSALADFDEAYRKGLHSTP